MEITGTTHGLNIVLDQPLPLPDGTRVHLDVSPVAANRKGSPDSLISLAGTLTDDEAEAISVAAGQCRRIDPALWNGSR